MEGNAIENNRAEDLLLSRSDGDNRFNGNIKYKKVPYGNYLITLPGQKWFAQNYHVNLNTKTTSSQHGLSLAQKIQNGHAKLLVLEMVLPHRRNS